MISAHVCKSSLVMPTTIKDIARQAGVSHTTVSRALHNSRLISEETTERIQKIASELGYRPSVAARSLKTKRSQALGVIVSHIADPYFSEILQGIDDIAQENGYSLFIASAEHDPKRENSILQTMREHRVDGVILCSPHFTPEQSLQLNSYDIPIVAINNQSAEEYHFAIYHDDVDGSRQASQHLISLGHTRIAYLGDASSGRTTQERMMGFRQAMKDAGMEVGEEYLYQIPGNTAIQGLTGAAYFLSLKEKPTAVICYNDMMAVGVLKGFQQAGISVPEDISVTGFDNIMYSDFTHPPLTTIDQPKRFLGAEATRMMFAQLKPDGNQRLTPDTVRRLKGMLLIRKTTAPPRMD